MKIHKRERIKKKIEKPKEDKSKWYCPYEENFCGGHNKYTCMCIAMMFGD